jgi:nitrite transporter NirC
MINIGYDLLSSAAEKKISFFKADKLAYFVLSMLAGVYVGLCMITILILASMFPDFIGIKLLQGFSFAAALSLVVFAGAELFTGNVFVMVAGVKCGTVNRRDAFNLCTFCYIGNFAGSVLIAAFFLGTGYLKGAVLDAANYSIMAKTNPNFAELLIRGILCNILVCAAVWCVYRLKSESGKLIAIFWCIYLFVVCGFEHSIANMTLFSMKSMTLNGIALIPQMSVNLLATTIGNILGGVMLSLAYWMVGRNTS